MSSPSTARDRPPEEADEDTSFARGLRILLTVADRGEVRAEELSVLLDTPTSTVYRYLRTLTAFGFVDRHDGRYLLGQRLVIGSGTNVTSEQLIRVADPVLRYLVAETGETAVITRRIGLSAVCLHQVESDQPLRVSIAPGSMSPLHAGAIGRVLLAYALPEIVEAVIARGLEQLTPYTPKRGRPARNARRDPSDGHRPERRRAGFRLRGNRGSHFPRRWNRRRHRNHRSRRTLRARLAGPRDASAPRGRPDDHGGLGGRGTTPNYTYRIVGLLHPSY